jgi:hypothetical protein
MVRLPGQCGVPVGHRGIAIAIAKTQFIGIRQGRSCNGQGGRHIRTWQHREEASKDWKIERVEDWKSGRLKDWKDLNIDTLTSTHRHIDTSTHWKIETSKQQIVFVRSATPNCSHVKVVVQSCSNQSFDNLDQRQLLPTATTNNVPICDGLRLAISATPTVNDAGWAYVPDPDQSPPATNRQIKCAAPAWFNVNDNTAWVPAHILKNTVHWSFS